MEAVRKHAMVEEDGRVTIGGLPYKKGDRVEVIVMKERKRGMTVRQLLQSPVVGMWEDRNDIADSSEFARELRRKAERRRAGGT